MQTVKRIVFYFVLGILVVYGISHYVSRPRAAVTPDPTVDVAHAKRNAGYIDPRRLTADPDAYEGRNFWVQGNALNVEQNKDYTWINFQAGVRGRETTEQLVVTIQPSDSSILSDECYRFYVMGTGTAQVTRTLTGASDTLPAVGAYAYESAPRAQFYGCEEP